MNPASRASSARRCSWAGYFQACISTIAQAADPHPAAASAKAAPRPPRRAPRSPRRRRRRGRRPRPPVHAAGSAASTLQVEQAGPGLIADAQRVGKAAIDDQQRALAAAFQQGVGGHGGAHLHGLRRCPGGIGDLAGPSPSTLADAGDRGVAIALPDSRSAACGSRAAAGPGSRATMSVKVPPRSIQNCQAIGTISFPRTCHAPACEQRHPIAPPRAMLRSAAWDIGARYSVAPPGW